MSSIALHEQALVGTGKDGDGPACPSLEPIDLCSDGLNEFLKGEHLAGYLKGLPVRTRLKSRPDALI